MPKSLQIALKNTSSTPNFHAYITGIAIANGKRCLLQSDLQTLYYPTEVSSIGSPLATDCAIPLGPPGNTVTITIPQIAGGRIWIAEGHLTFLLNPGGPALVEPSVLNPSDPNAGVNFGFVEFTLNEAQLYANISYVDFVSRVPVAISLEQESGAVQFVAGMAAGGLDQVVEGLRAQTGRDGWPWEKLVVQGEEGRNLRVLNATHGGAVGAGFEGYYEPHVEEVWGRYQSGAKMRINTQAGPGVLEGRVEKNGKLRIGDEEFEKPNTADILGCNSGPFTTGPSATRNAIIPRLAAAFVRSTLCQCEDHPSQPDTFYRQDPTNHYARLVHEHNIDKKGYAFAYDDVQPDGGEDQSGKVNAGDPKLFSIIVGGSGAAPPGSQGSQGYNRPPPPPPPGASGESKEKQGLRGKIRGFAENVMR